MSGGQGKQKPTERKVKNTMMSKQVIREYKQGRQKNFFLRETDGMYFLEKITKACGFTIKCGNEDEIMNFINENGFKFVGLVVRA